MTFRGHFGKGQVKTGKIPVCLLAWDYIRVGLYSIELYPILPGMMFEAKHDFKGIAGHGYIGVKLIAQRKSDLQAAIDVSAKFILQPNPCIH